MAVQMAQMAAFPITRIVNFMVIGGMADVMDARAIGSLARFTAVIFIANLVRMRVVMVILAFEGAILRILVREEDKNSEDERHIVKIYSHNYACVFTHLN